jgi:hypothetical protein
MILADTLADVFRRSTAEAATELRGLLDRASTLGHVNPAYRVKL